MMKKLMATLAGALFFPCIACADLPRGNCLRPAARTDLSHCDFTQHRLSGLDLSVVRLVGAKLDNADLRKTKLSGADLSGASAKWANFSFAEFSNANLRRLQ